MTECPVAGERVVVAHNQPAKIAEPSNAALDDPAASVTAQRTTVLQCRLAAVLAVRRDQPDAAPMQAAAQRVAVVALLGDHPLRFLPWPTGAMPSSYLDRRQRFLRQPDLVRGRSVKSHSQRKTRAVDHHHPLRPLTPPGFSDRGAPFLAGAELPSRNASLHFTCWRSFNSARNARQMFNQVPCSSHCRSRRQQVVGDGNSSGKSCQRAPLRRIHKMPSRTLRSSARGRPPCGRLGRFGSKGWILAHWASVSSRPYRAIRPPPGAAHLHDRPPTENKYCEISPLYRVLKWLLV